MTNRVGDLELDQDLTYQQREWRIERISWIVWALLVLAALLGILGPGPLSKATAGNAGDPIWVEYQRFVRHRSPTELIVYVAPDGSEEGALSLQIDQELTEKAQIERIDPEPAKEQAGMGRITYTFPIDEGDAVLHVIYHLELESFGPSTIRVGLEGGPEVSINQFVYP